MSTSESRGAAHADGGEDLDAGLGGSSIPGSSSRPKVPISVCSVIYLEREPGSGSFQN